MEDIHNECWGMFIVYVYTAAESHLWIPSKGIARGLSPNFHIHVSVSDLQIPRIGPQIFLHDNKQTNRGNI